jgi:alpha,alpha-trehalose phosphorylase
LSACTQAIVAAETGHLGLAYDYLGEAAFVDLHDLAHNTKDGLHMASLAGGWMALVCGFGGFRDHGGTLRFAPRLPEPLDRLHFRLSFRGRCLSVEIRTEEVTYALNTGDTLEIEHHGEAVTVRPDEPVTRPVPPPAHRPRPRQPPGREPRRRVPEDAGSAPAFSPAGAAARRS